MNRGRRALLTGLALLAGCRPDADTPAQPASPDNGTASALEQAAMEAGVVADVGKISPIGLYRNRHEAGLDSLCIVSAEEGRLAFGLDVAFGEGIECHGHGTVRASGDKLIFNFARSACLAIARYDGDRISFPGALDVDCESLCSDRGSLEGVIFPRVSRDEGVARSARADGGGKLCS